VVAALRLDQLVFPTAAGPLRLSVEVAADELVGVVAGAEAGRALCRVLVGLARPVSGRILVDAQDVTDEPPARRHVGYLPAEGGLLPHLTVARNIEYGLRRRESVRQVTSDWVDTVTDQLELRHMRDLRPHQLSEAQRWRVGLARAAARLPEVLVVDQPGPAGGVDLLRELLPLVVPDGAPGPATLVCSADPEILATVPRKVEPERADR
jgi:ABC-type sulfate/molybdate transport systems ATPase subunit